MTPTLRNVKRWAMSSQNGDSQRTQSCSKCRCQLTEGRDVVEVQEGVVGVRGFIPLEKILTFCSIDCLKEYFTGERGYERLPRRIP